MTSTRETVPYSPIEDCLRKTQFRSKKLAKVAAGRRTGPTVVYECRWPNRDGFVSESEKHWHYARARRHAPSGSASA